TKIVVSGDMDEYSIAGLAAEPVDIYGVGTSVVVGSGAPTAGLVYKLVEVDGRPVAKRSEHKASRGGRKSAVRRHRASGTAIAELVTIGPDGGQADGGQADGAGPNGRPGWSEGGDRRLTVPLMLGGKPLSLPSLAESRAHHRAAIEALPWEALKLSDGDPGLAVTIS
ncbi:MAG: pncB1, partial [Frankiales bacterium]|nr:pncB1 [Frankiales bacterium]